MNFQNPSYTPAAANQRIRTLWQKFEQSQAKDRSQLDTTIKTALEKAEAEWNNRPNSSRINRIQRNAAKAQIAKKIKAPYFDKARAKWHGMLEPLGLKPDYWTDLTEDEKRRITNTLGAEDESDEDAVVPELTPAPIVQPTQQTHFFQPLAPSFSTSSRATNLSSSSYAFVNPSEFNSEEEDFEFEIPLSNPVATSVDLTSEDDDDPAVSVPNYPGTRPNIVGSSFSRASLSASNPSNTPSARPLVSGFVYNTVTSGASTKRPPTQPPQVSQNEGKSSLTKAKIPRQPYVGPSLDPADEPIDEDLEFEKFKMRTRMAKIVEFHEAAALAEISLSIEMYKARKQLNNSKEEDAPRVLEHQKRMVQLQKEKEEERKAIVKSERARRQSDLARHLTPGDDVKEVPMSNGAEFKTWDPSSFQEEINLPSRFNLDTLLSDNPANVENLLSEMFADDYQPSVPDGSVPSFFNSSSTSPNPDAFRGSSSIQEQLRHSHSSMSWNKTQSNSSRKKTHLSPFGESSDEEDGTPAAVKPNAPTPATTTTSAWPSKDGGATPVNSAWSSKKTTATISQPRQGSSVVSSNPNPSFAMDEIEPEPTATPFMNSKAAKGKKPSVSASDKSPVLPPTVETATASSKAPVAETPAVPPTPTPALAPAPTGKKQTKKQRQAANKKGGAAASSAATVTATAIPEQEPEPEPVLPQRESPKLETPVAASNPAPQTSEHTSWLPKTVPAMARARMESGPPTPSFSWDEITSTPRPASKIPAHVQETLNSAGTPRPSMLKKKNLMAEMFNATSSRTTLEQMPPPPPAPIAKGPVWSSSTPGPSLWGKTKADFETAKPAQKPVGGGSWVPGGYDCVDDYKDEGDGSGGSGSGSGGGNEGTSLWVSMTSHSKQNGKAASIPVKQQQPTTLWGKTKADFETAKVAVQQPVGGGSWVPGGFEGVNDYNKGEGDGGGGGGGGGGGNEGSSLWGSMTSHLKQNGKAASIPVKQQQPSVAAQRLRRVSEAASSPAPRAFGTKDLSDMGQPAPPTLNSNSKKAQGKKNGKGKQRATIEDVSDEETDNIDILPQDSNYIMEPKILEPKPSVPPFVYNPIIDFADNNDVNDIGYLSSTFKPTASTASSSSQDDFFGSESRFSNPFKTQGATTSMGAADWGTMGGKHARWTPAVTNDGEESGSPSFPGSVAPRLQAKPSVQQTPIWGQPNPSAKDKGKGKKK